MRALANSLPYGRRQHRRLVKRIATDQQNEITLQEISLADTFEMTAGSPRPRRPVTLRMALENDPLRIEFGRQFSQQIICLQRSTTRTEPGN